MTNVFDAFSSAAERFRARPAVEMCLRTELVTYTYGDLCRLVDAAAGLAASLGARRGTRCAILADNDAYWLGAYLGILRLGAIAVPLDTAYRPHQVRTIVADSGATVLFTSTRHLATVREASEGLAEAPRTVLVDGSAAGVLSLDEAAGSDLSSPLPEIQVQRDDPAVILYTSGTTSDPKGVVLTHGNLLAEKEAVFKIITVNEHDRVLAILPLFHALAQIANLLLPLTVGARVVFLETITSADMMRALAERRISAFCVVPQFYYLLHQRVTERVAASRWPVRAAFASLLRLNGWLRHRLRLNLGRVLFRQVHAALGNRMRILVSGGSRFDPRVGRDLYRMGFNILQAYGLTECSGAATLTRPGDPHIESVGQPLPGVAVRIVEEPAAPRDREHPDGEVLIKGPIVMAGYHHRPDANAEALQDGWLYTGDLGYLDGRGRLHITGRRKDVIVLASGKNIYPEEIEAHYAQSPLIREVCVLGVARPDEPAAERLHAIVVPNLDLLRERRIVNTREALRFDIEGLSMTLSHYKRVLSFDVWHDELPRTTTRKLKRNVIQRQYREKRLEASRTVEASEWSDADQVWAADPHVERSLTAIRAAARSGRAVAPGASLELDLGFDSMERVELLARLEHAFHAKVADETAHAIYTVRDLVEALRPQDAAAAGGGAVEIDPWARILTEEPARGGEAGDLAFLLEPKPLFAPFAFLVMKVVYGLARVFAGLRVAGRQQIPAEGAFLISPNHQSYLDAFLLVSALPYATFRNLFFVGASEYFATPFRKRFARLVNVVPVDPDANLVRAMRAGAFGLRRGKVLVLFPEGERSPDGGVKTFKKGAAILSHQLGVPIVPVAVRGVFEIWPRGTGIRWRVLRPWGPARPALQFGPPRWPRDVAETPGEDRYLAITDALRTAVTAMWNGLPTSAK